MALHVIRTGTGTDNLWIISKSFILNDAIDHIQSKPSMPFSNQKASCSNTDATIFISPFEIWLLSRND
jgi:hypothetical protein